MRKLHIFFLLLVLTACSRQHGELKETVARYDALLAEGYRTLNMNPLAQVATDQRAVKAYHHMAALGEAGLKMDSKLRSMKFLDVAFSGDKAGVTTEEIWDYSYLDIKSAEHRFDNTVTYNLKYELLKKSGRWLVEDITVVSAVEDKDSRSIFRRPSGEDAQDRDRK